MDKLTKGLMRTQSGIYLNAAKGLKQEEIVIEDIAHSLSMQPRFAGHSKMNYQVARHCIWVAENVAKEDKLAALLHDASEAYLVDIPTPVKEKIDNYYDIEHMAMWEISKKFNFKYPFHPDILIADEAALYFEWENAVLDQRLDEWTFQETYDRFMLAFHKYKTFKK